MSFLNRLKFYLFGFAIGLVIVYYTLLKDRERDPWLPEGRVLNGIEKASLGVSNNVNCLLDCYGYTIENFDSIFWDNAEVHFSKSKTQKEPFPEYYITSKLNDDEILVFVELDDRGGKATLKNLENLSHPKSCDCNTGY